MQLGLGTGQKKEPKVAERWAEIRTQKALRRACCTILDGGDMSYLEGLRDAGVEDADTLIEAIKKYDSIHVREEC